MTSLQQIEIAKYSSQLDPHIPLGFHRQSCTLLSLQRRASSVKTSRPLEGKKKWTELGECSLPPSPRYLGFFALEAYQAFMLLYEYNSSVRASFLDLSCTLINTWDLDNSYNGNAAGFDQKRKDLILACKNGDIRAFSVRMVRGILHVIFRTQVRVPRKHRSLPVEVATQDIPGTFLLLTAEGSITCWETSQLLCLWTISSNRFRSAPMKVFVDKFGSNFAVLCPNESLNRSFLEVWSPPKDFGDCGAHRFVRFDIPLKAGVVSLSLETVGGDFGTALMVIQDNRHAQLWSIHGENIQQHCDLISTGESSPFSGSAGIDFDLRGVGAGVSSGEKYLANTAMMEGFFVDGFGCPANEALYFGVSGSYYCLYALHSPSSCDLNWKSCVIAQSMCDNMAKHSHGRNMNASPEPLATFRAGSPSGGEGGAVEDGAEDSSVGSSDSYSLSEFLVDSPKKSNGYADGEVFSFVPAIAMPSLVHSMEGSDTVLQMVKPNGLAVLSSEMKSSSRIHRCTRSGLIHLQHSRKQIPPKSELQITKASFAYRSEKIVCISDIKEGFVFDTNPFAGIPPQQPIILEVGMSAQAVCTVLLACDVFIKLPLEALQHEDLKAPIEGPGVVGSHVLALFGDSEGKVFYSLCGKSSVLQQGFIRAHANPVVSVAASGDCARALWNVGTEAQGRNALDLLPVATPGSAIVSMDCEGEVKIWLPLFTQAGAARSKQSQILNIYQMSWYLSGVISTQTYDTCDTITSCCLDPTCTTAYIGFGSGQIEQWVLPGITRSSNGKAQVLRHKVWSSQPHQTTVTSMKIWMNLPDTSVNARDVDFSTLNDSKISKSNRYAAIIADNSSGASASKLHVAYTLSELRKIAESSTFVTAAKDNTIVLWRLFVAKAVELPSDLAELKRQKMFHHCRFLEPIQCQKFTVSSVPTEALCYPLLHQAQGNKHWRLSAVVNGIVITIAQAEKGSLFLTGAQKPDRNAKGHEALEYNSHDKPTITAVEPIPVVCQVINPLRTSALMKISGVPCRYSWHHSWQKDEMEEPVQNVVLDESTTDRPGDDSDHHRHSPNKDIAKKLSPAKRVNIGEDFSQNIHDVKTDMSLQNEDSAVRVEHAGVKMKVPSVNTDLLNRIAPSDHSLKYYASKTSKNSSIEMPSSFATSESIAPTIKPPSPPLGPGALSLSKPLGPQPEFHPREVISVDEAGTIRSSGTQVVTVPSKGIVSKDNDIDDNLSIDDTTLDNHHMDERQAHGGSLDFEDSLSDHEGAARTPPKTFKTMTPLDKYNKSLSPSLRQPYRSSALGPVPAPRDPSKSERRFLVSPERDRGFTASPPQSTSTQASSHFKMFVNPVDDSMLPQPKNLHKFRSREEAENLASQYSYFRNPPSYYEKSGQSVYYNKGTREKALEAKQMKAYLEEMNTLASELDSESGDDEMDKEKIQQLEEYMISSELALYSNMSPEEKEEFLKKKRKENQKIVKESKNAFIELAGVEIQRTESKSESDKAEEEEALKKAKVSSRKVMGWSAVTQAISTGINMKNIMEMISASSKRKKANTSHLNVKEFTTFAKKLNQVIAENECPPEIRVTAVHPKHDRVDLSLETTKRGTAIIMIVEDRPEMVIPPAKYFDNLNTLLFRYEGVTSITTHKLTDEESVIASIRDLEPMMKYKAIICGEHNDVKQSVRTTDHQIKENVLSFTTQEEPDEDLDLEWGRLTLEQKQDEAMAVIYDIPTQETAEKEGISVPTAEDVEVWFSEAESPSRRKSEEKGEAEKVVELFLEWWTGGDEELGQTSHRSDFLEREALHCVRDNTLIHQCADEKFLTIEQSEVLKNQVIASKSNPNALKESKEFIIFRSWLKGGRVMSNALNSRKKRKRLAKFEELRTELWNRELNLSNRMSKALNSENRSDGEDEDRANAVDVSSFEDSCHSSEVLLGGDLVYHEEIDDEDPREVQLCERSERMVELAQSVEDSITLVGNLVMAQQHGEEQGLTIEDLERRRGLLTYEDVVTIMAMRKLKELCERKMMRLKDLDDANFQKVTGASTFVLVDEQELTPEEPPQATMMSLVGSNKRPLRSWENMSPEERVLEIQLACTMVQISELAVEVGLSIPNPEDGNIIGSGFDFPVRAQRWSNYQEWYVGNEAHTDLKKRRPSLARIMFADWEKKMVKRDAGLLELVKKKARKNSDNSPSRKPSISKMSKSKRLSGKRLSDVNLASQNLRNLSRTASTGEDNELVKTYETQVNKDCLIRCQFFRKALQAVFRSRNLGMMRLLLPPACPGRLHSQFLFPRLGLVTPSYTEPVARFQPNPSFSNESYSVAEVLLWYKPSEMEGDNLRMQQAEVEGKKHQAYLEWLAEEEARMIAGRVKMREEDLFGHHLREYTRSIETDVPRIVGDPAYRDFIHGEKLPGEYSQLREGARYFEQSGCGLDNEDEVEDVLERMRYEAESAVREKKELKKKLLEERKRKEEEEKRRQELLERDQRIEENRDRLVRLRHHLENLKEDRRREAERKQQEAVEMELQAKLEAEERALEAERSKREEMERKRREEEIRLMTVEDECHHEQRDHEREFASMEHEDIQGLMLREHHWSTEQTRLQRIAELEEIYCEFVPFRFEKSKIRVPHLHFDGSEQEEEEAPHVPDQVDWKMLLQSSSRGDKGSGSDRRHHQQEVTKYDLSEVFDGNPMNDQILEKLLYSDSAATRFTEMTLQGDRDISSEKPLPSRETATPLVWKGPAKKKSSSSLSRDEKKTSKGTSLLKSNELYLKKLWKSASSNQIVLMRTSNDSVLKSLGLDREAIRSFRPSGQLEDEIKLPPLRLKTSSSVQSLREKPPFSSSQPSRPSSVSFDSPDACSVLQESFLRGERRAAPLPVAKSLSQLPITRSIRTPAKSSSRASTTDRSIREERQALREFISQSSQRFVDPFYVEACRPGLRGLDSISSSRQRHRQRRGDSGESDGDAMRCSGSPRGDGGGVGGRVDHYNDGLQNRDNQPDGHDNDHIQSQKDPTGPSSEQSCASEEFKDDLSLSPKHLDDPEFHLSDRGVVRASNCTLHDEYPPPFYRKPFGVKGHSKPIKEESFVARAKKSAEEIAAERERKEERLRRRVGKDQSTKRLLKKHGSTAKSLQRDQYAVLQRSSFEETSRQYSCGDVNFINNMGL